MPVQGNVRRVFLRKQKYSKLVFTAISGSIVDRLGFLRAGALKRHLEDGMRIAPPCAILNSSLLCKLGTYSFPDLVSERIKDLSRGVKNYGCGTDGVPSPQKILHKRSAEAFCGTGSHLCPLQCLPSPK